LLTKKGKPIQKLGGGAGLVLLFVINVAIGGFFRVLTKLPKLIRKLGGGAGVLLLVVIILAVGGFYYAGHDLINRPWTARARVGAHAVGTTIYVFGGLHRDRGAVADVLAFDLQRRRVSRFGDLPWSAMDATVAVSGERLFVLGGYGGRGAYSDIAQLDPTLDAITTVAQMPEPRFFGAVASSGGTIYYAGGWDRSDVRSEVFAWSPDTGAFEVIAMLPAPVRHCAAAVSGDYLYVLGGEDDDGNPQAQLAEIDLVRGEVRRTLEVASPISRSTLVASGEHLYVFGGWNHGAIDDIARISIGGATLTYERVGRLSTPCSDCVAFTLDERILLVGGEPGQAGRELRISEFDPDTEMFRVHRFRGSI